MHIWRLVPSLSPSLACEHSQDELARTKAQVEATEEQLQFKIGELAHKHEVLTAAREEAAGLQAELTALGETRDGVSYAAVTCCICPRYQSVCHLAAMAVAQSLSACNSSHIPCLRHTIVPATARARPRRVRRGVARFYDPRSCLSRLTAVEELGRTNIKYRRLQRVRTFGVLLATRIHRGIGHRRVADVRVTPKATSRRRASWGTTKG